MNKKFISEEEKAKKKIQNCIQTCLGQFLKQLRYLSEMNCAERESRDMGRSSIWNAEHFGPGNLFTFIWDGYWYFRAIKYNFNIFCLTYSIVNAILHNKNLVLIEVNDCELNNHLRSRRVLTKTRFTNQIEDEIIIRQRTEQMATYEREKRQEAEKMKRG